MKLLAYRIAYNVLRTTRIISIKKASPSVKIFTFKDKLCARAEPGQFLMLWIPGVDEIPLSILSAEKNGEVSVAIKKVGEATEVLHKMSAGEVLGVRGPFGNSFSTRKGRVLMVGGGTGIAPLMFLARKLVASDVNVTFLVGAKTRDELLFFDDLCALCGEGNVLAVTEDGSYGVKGLVTEPLKKLLSSEKFNMIYTCGPEQMMFKVFCLAEEYGVDLEASLERLMRCAIGICGSCIIGRYRVCRDGPVFSIKQLREVKGEFGSWKRDFDGKKIPIE